LNVKTTFPNKTNGPNTGAQHPPPNDETLNIKLIFPNKTNGLNTGVQNGPPKDKTLHLAIAFRNNTNGPKTGAQNLGMLQPLEDEEFDKVINAVGPETRTCAAIDSGVCRNVTCPRTLPFGVKVSPNNGGKHFSGAEGEVTEKFAK
jgi:hypothetical protein